MKLTSIITVFTILMGTATYMAGGLIFELYGILAPFRLVSEFILRYQAEYTLPLIGFIVIWAVLSALFSRLSTSIKWF